MNSATGTTAVDEVDPSLVKINRLRRKIEKRDRVIAALARENEQLKSVLATKTKDAVFMNVLDLKKSIERSVTSALCNVRMIPVFGGHDSGRILEVREVKDDK